MIYITPKTLGLATCQSYFLVEGGGLWFHNEYAIIGVNLFIGLCFFKLECENVKNLPVLNRLEFHQGIATSF